MGMEGRIMALKKILGGGLYNAARGLEGSLGGNVSPKDVAHITEFLESRGVKQPMQRSPEVGRRSDSLRSLLGLKQSDIEPEDFLSRLGQDTVSTLGLALLGGGRPSLRSLAPSATGVAASKAAEALGLPEVVQDAVRLGSEYKTRRGLLAKEGKFPANKAARAEQLYNQTEVSLKPGERGSAKSLNKFFDGVDKIHKREVNRDTMRAVDEIAHTLRSNIDKQGNIDIKNAYEIKKSLNKEYSDAKASVRPYIEEARKGIEKTLRDHSALNPEFVKSMEEASGLYSFNKENEMITDFLKSSGKLRSKLVKGAFDALSYIPRAFSNKSVRKYYLDLLDAVIKDDKSAAFRAASRLSKQDLSEYQEEDGEQYGGWHKVSGNQPSDFGGWTKVA
jgi:hypothetical protein